MHFDKGAMPFSYWQHRSVLSNAQVRQEGDFIGELAHDKPFWPRDVSCRCQSLARR
jgi:hypothetical protein